eukprot:TRINITY_DN4174_c0_g1_i2.p1 TRINITY_DN4174_c0_g1~~TRINITY_DN4174_c0_g1_i2.p1  ORF type:complete len:233 (+),score=52.49 TRINITY_DN4174_c0_g1_i2:149-847(+)
MEDTKSTLKDLEDSSEGETPDDCKKEAVPLEEILADSEPEDELAGYEKLQVEEGKMASPTQIVTKERVEESPSTVTPNPMEEIKGVTPGGPEMHYETPFGETPQDPYDECQFISTGKTQSNFPPTLNANDDQPLQDPMETVDRYENSSRTAEVLVNFARPIEDMMSRNSLNVTRMVYGHLKNVGAAFANPEYEQLFGRPSCIFVWFELDCRRLMTTTTVSYTHLTLPTICSV